MNPTLRQQLRAADPAGQEVSYSAEHQAHVVAWALDQRLETGPVTPPPSRRRVVGAHWSRSRFGLLAGVAAVTGGLVMAPAFGLLNGRPDPAASASAAEVLHRAALAALAEPDPKVPDDAFIYVESVYSAANLDWTPTGVKPDPRTERRLWISVDDRHVGLMQERRAGSPGEPESTQWVSSPYLNEDCQNGFYVDGVTTGLNACIHIRGYRDDLPTTAEGMLNWLRLNGGGWNTSRVRSDEEVWNLLTDGFLVYTYVPSASRAAMFEAAAKISGVHVVSNVVDAEGRTGIAIARDYQGISYRLIFDAKTYAFLGDQEVYPVSDNTGKPKGTVATFQAVTRVAIVAKRGALPD